MTKACSSTKSKISYRGLGTVDATKSMGGDGFSMVDKSVSG